jgi:hypothetical protein
VEVSGRLNAGLFRQLRRLDGSGQLVFGQIVGGVASVGSAIGQYLDERLVVLLGLLDCPHLRLFHHPNALALRLSLALSLLFEEYASSAHVGFGVQKTLDFLGNSFTLLLPFWDAWNLFDFDLKLFRRRRLRRSFHNGLCPFD